MQEPQKENNQQTDSESESLEKNAATQNQLNQKSTLEKIRLEMNRKKLVFCALLEIAKGFRNDFFDIDLEEHASLNAKRIAEDIPKHSNDKKWATRQTFALRDQISNMNHDKLNFDGRIDVLVKKTLAKLSAEQKNEYQEVITDLQEFLK